MIYTINNIAYDYSKFIIRPHWLNVSVNPHVGLPNTKITNTIFNSELTPSHHKKLFTFQSSELLCWSEDLSFLNLTGYFKNVLKALHICWLACINNKRVVFVDQTKTPNILRPELISRNLLKQYTQHSLPRLLEPGLITNNADVKKPKHLMTVPKKNLKTTSNFSKQDTYGNLNRFLKLSTYESPSALKNAINDEHIKAKLGNDEKLTSIYREKKHLNHSFSHISKHLKHHIKAQAVFAMLSTRASMAFVGMQHPGFFSNCKNVFNEHSNLTHLTNSKSAKSVLNSNYLNTIQKLKQVLQFPKLKNATAGSSNSDIIRQMCMLNGNTLQKKKTDLLFNKPNRNTATTSLFRLETRGLQAFKIANDILNLKNTHFPLYNGKNHYGVAEAAQKLRFRFQNRAKKRFKPFLESNLNYYTEHYHKPLKRHNRFVIKFYTKYLQKRFQQNNKVRSPANFNLRFGPLQKSYSTIVNTNLYKQSLHFSRNSWLLKADVIFFIDPQSCNHIVKQAKSLNIPTLGLISCNAIPRSGRPAFRNFCLDDDVHYAILGNPSSAFFVQNILELFIKSVRTLKNSRFKKYSLKF